MKNSPITGHPARIAKFAVALALACSLQACSSTLPTPPSPPSPQSEAERIAYAEAYYKAEAMRRIAEEREITERQRVAAIARCIHDQHGYGEGYICREALEDHRYDATEK